MRFAAGAIAATTARERYPEVVVLGWTGESQRASTPRSPVQEPKCDVWTPQLLEFFYSQILPLCCVSRQVPLKRPRKPNLTSVHVQLGCLHGSVGGGDGHKIRYELRARSSEQMDLADGAPEPRPEVEVSLGGIWGGNRENWEEPHVWVAQGCDWTSRPVTYSGPSDAANSARSGEQVAGCQTPPLVEAVVDSKHPPPPGIWRWGGNDLQTVWRTVESALLNEPSPSHAQGSMATATLGGTAVHPKQLEPRATARSKINSGECRAKGSMAQMGPKHLGADGPGNRGSWEARG